MKELTEIPYGKTPEVLVLGNGINRAFSFASWDELISEICTVKLTEEQKKSLKDVPYPLQPVILTEDHVGTGMKKISGQLSDLQPSEAEKEMLRLVKNLPVDAILTTNYTYELEKALEESFISVPGRKCKYRQKAFESGSKEIDLALHTYMNVISDMPIWHIHGEASKADSMIIGHYYYGKLLSKIQQYIKVLIRRSEGNAKREQGMIYRSWIDYFMLGNVTIVGLGMDLSEMDLWWLVNCKKRHFPDTTVTFYCPDIKPEQKMLAEAYGMIVKTEGLVGDDYKKYYNEILTKKLH